MANKARTASVSHGDPGDERRPSRSTFQQYARIPALRGIDNAGERRWNAEWIAALLKVSAIRHKRGQAKTTA